MDAWSGLGAPAELRRRGAQDHRGLLVAFVKDMKADRCVCNASHRRADGIAGRPCAPSSTPDQRVRRGSLLPRSWAPVRALPRVAGLSAARFAGFTRPLAAAMATVSYSAA